MSDALLELNAISPASEHSRPTHIRDPSFSYDSESVFEVQSTKSPTLPSLPCAFYTGASLNSSQVLSAQIVFPANTQEELREAVLCSSDFGQRCGDQKPQKIFVATKQPVAMVLGSSVIHPPDFPEDEERRGANHSRTGILQRYGRLKKTSDGNEERFRGLSSPHYERTLSTLAPRKVLTPHNKLSQRPQSKRPKAKGLLSSPFDTPIHTAYLPSLKTLDQKRMVTKKSARSPAVRRLKAFTPEARLTAHID